MIELAMLGLGIAIGLPLGVLATWVAICVVWWGYFR
jgi:hypothetical protein